MNSTQQDHVPLESELDLTVLDTLANHDHTKVNRYALLFFRSIEDVLGQMDEALACGDLARLGALGHRAKSTARSIGAFGFSQACLQLEHAAQTHNDAAATAIATTLRPLYEGIHQALLQHLATPSPCPAALTNPIGPPVSPASRSI